MHPRISRALPHDEYAALDALAQVGGIVTITRIWPNEWHVTICGETRWAETLPLAICVTLLALSSQPESTPDGEVL